VVAIEIDPRLNRAAGLICNSLPGCPRPWRRRPISWIRPSSSNRLTILAMAGAVRPVNLASATRVITLCTRIAWSVMRRL
jgi:hypothetical protein